MLLCVVERRGGADGRRRDAVKLVLLVSCTKFFEEGLRMCASARGKARDQNGAAPLVTFARIVGMAAAPERTPARDFGGLAARNGEETEGKHGGGRGDFIG